LPIGDAFIELASVDSTNNHAMAQVHAGTASHGTVYYAHDQWAGKGQRGKTWNSAPGENIILSAVLEPVFLPITRSFDLSIAIALACHDLFSRHAGLPGTTIKWPNDLYWRDRKAGGILIENQFRGDHWLIAIAGIGININQTEFSSSLHNPVSLRQITGRSFSAVQLAHELCACLQLRFEQLQAASGDDSLLAEYNSFLYQRGETITLKKDGAIIEVRLLGVNAKGELLAETITPTAAIPTVNHRWRTGEVEWVL
jgi:BirA family transcriptional regulator, biotin operon repressor / biotin---[acetyl-CoA-carboxylase] ligase